MSFWRSRPYSRRTHWHLRSSAKKYASKMSNFGRNPNGTAKSSGINNYGPHDGGRQRVS